MSKWKNYKNKAWYAYDGLGDPYHASSYRKVTIKPRFENGTSICAIYADAGDIFPANPLSTNIQQYIANALVTGLPQPARHKKYDKHFVYLKD